jgi:putative hemolysin
VRNILDDGLPSWLTFVIAFSLVTYLPIVLGELMPKALTLDRAETLAALVARPMEMISVALWPCGLRCGSCRDPRASSFALLSRSGT